MPAKRRRKVALLIETSNAYARGLLRGVVAYEQRMENWSIFLPEQERGGAAPLWLERWQGDGVIARIENDQIAQACKKTGLPLVDLSAARHIEGVPWVETNNKAIAELATKHLLEREFTNFAFCGDPGFNWSNWRLDEFREIVEATGAKLHVFQSMNRNSPDFSWNNESSRMGAWLDSLPKPIGVMACYDIMARQMLDLCLERDIAVPEQVAVVGVDNDSLICELCSPPLTSIDPNPFRAGYVAAGILAKMMGGEEVSSDVVLVDPIGIEERQSTDIYAVDDPDIAKALRFIRENATSNLRVGDILEHVGLTRRKFEHRFQKLVGRTPHQEIQRRRISVVKQMLQRTDLPISEIARATGYDHPEYLCVVFQRETGQTTGEFRAEKKKQQQEF